MQYGQKMSNDLSCELSTQASSFVCRCPDIEGRSPDLFQESSQALLCPIVDVLY